MKSASHSPHNGFTLLELLVAIAILAMVSILCWRGLASLTATREHLEPQTRRAHALLATFGQLRIDLDQMPRHPGLYALPMQPLRVLTLDGGRCLQLLRSATLSDDNPAQGVQVVLYCVRQNHMVRMHTVAQRYFSASVSGTMEADSLLDNVRALAIRVWRPGTGWIDPLADTDTANTSGLEIQLTDENGHQYRQVFAL
jgi:general secretion pathway protein J